jgi:uncharacterized membrane protein
VNEPSEGGLQRSPDLDRIAFFSDGVFAIAITLLVLDIRLPEPIPSSHASGLVSALVEELWPDFYSFLISFWFVGTLWIAHHRVFHYIRGYDKRLRPNPARAQPVLFDVDRAAAFLGNPPQPF